MIHLIWSPEEFLAGELADRFAAKAARDGEVVALTCESGGVPGLTEALFAPSLFTSKRAVVIREAERLGAAAAAELAAALSGGGVEAEVAVVAVSERSPAARKALKDVAKLHEASRPRRGELVAWVTKRMRSAKLQPGPQAAAALVESVGSNLRDLAQAVDQLATRLGDGGKVESSDVQAHFPGAAEQPVWVLFDAVGARDPGRALTVLRRILEAGDEPIAILFALVSQVRYVIRARGLLERTAGVSDADIAGALGVSPGRAAVLRRQAGRLSWEWLLRVHGLLAEADVELKGGDEGIALPPEIVLERTVAGACAA